MNATATRRHPLDVIRAVCEAENRNPVVGEVVTLDGVSTRIISARPSRWQGRRTVVFTCHGAEDGVRSCGLVIDRRTDAA